MLLMLSALFANDAHAACEKQVAAAKKAKGAAVAPAFQKVINCDAKAAKNAFPAMIGPAGDAESIVAVSMVAVDAEDRNPVWEMLGGIPNYDHRDIVAAGVGQQCAENEQVVKFLQGAYFGLRDIDFAQWDDAMVTCKAESFDTWLMETVQNPPAKQYDEKWAKVAEVYVERKGADSLDSLAIGASKAAEIGGPFEAILALMDAAVAPDLGEDISAEDQARLEDALVKMAQGLPPEQARSIADRLANAGSEGAAASLLPAIYPDRVQGGGGFVYGAVAVEAADCDGTLTAVLHTAEVTEPGNRYIIQDDLEAPMRAFKPKLGKCMSEGDWAVIATSEPLGDMDGFVSGLEAQFVEKGYDVKVKGEKGVTLD